MVDLMRLFGGEFTSIYSFLSNSHWGFDVEDNAYAIMKTDNGVVAMLHSSATQWRHRFNLEINLSKGAINLSGILTSTKSYAPEIITVIFAGKNDEGDPREQSTRYNEDKSWGREIDQFAENIIHDKQVVYGSSDEALRTMELVYSIYKSDSAWSEKYKIA